MEISLRRRLEGVARISISQSRQTVEVDFAQSRAAFSPSAFRDALGDAGIEVVTMQIDACGAIEHKDDRRWLIAGENQFQLEEAATPHTGRPLCVLGILDDRATPYRLTITTLELLTK